MLLVYIISYIASFLLSHFHWDHIQGLPFFDPAYNPSTTLEFYSPFDNAKEFFHNNYLPNLKLFH